MTEQKRTEIAMAAVDFAGLFNSYFDPVNVMGYKIQLTAPEGQSTGGGVQARQHITLVDEAGGKTVVVGACNPADKTAELRTHDHVATRFGQHYQGTPFPIPAGEFDGLRQKFAQFFQSQGYTVSTAAQKAARAGDAAAKGGSSTGLIIALVVLLLGLAGAAVWYFGFNQAQ